MGICAAIHHRFVIFDLARFLVLGARDKDIRNYFLGDPVRRGCYSHLGFIVEKIRIALRLEKHLQLLKDTP